MPRSPQFDAEVIDFTSGAANVETTVAHTLGRVPLEAFILANVGNGVLYRGPTAWTTTSIFVRSSVGSVAYRVFVI